MSTEREAPDDLDRDTTYRQLARLAGVIYGVLLTVLLLVPEPTAILGLQQPPLTPGGRGVHFMLFLLLGLLISAARWPIRRAALIAALVLYAWAIESLQALIPLRTVELLDYVENLTGLALGLTVYWLTVGWKPG
ncbi:MAG: hypothetical protein GXY83_22670 [Rhodopirellula sp.]|nr:hypothetical protein [Rhodopirellula sp.]